MSITHLEVRRHPLWQEQAAATREKSSQHSARIGLILVCFGAVCVLGALLLALLAT